MCSCRESLPLAPLKAATWSGPPSLSAISRLVEDIDILDIFLDPENPQRKGVETVPPGYVLVQDCRGDKTAASFGSILATRLKMRGVTLGAGCWPRPELYRADGIVIAVSQIRYSPHCAADRSWRCGGSAGPLLWFGERRTGCPQHRPGACGRRRHRRCCRDARDDRAGHSC